MSSRIRRSLSIRASGFDPMPSADDMTDLCSRESPRNHVAEHAGDSFTDSQNNVLGTMTSDSSGNYTFTGVAVAPGDVNLTVSIPADVAGNIGTATIDVHRNIAAPQTSDERRSPRRRSAAAPDTAIDLADVFTDADLGDDTLVQFNTNQGNFDVRSPRQGTAPADGRQLPRLRERRRLLQRHLLPPSRT